MKQKQYTIQELSELTGFSRRTIRYYIQEGLLKPPAGRGRGGYYYDSHLNSLSKIRQLQNQGLQLSSISKILKEAVTETLDYVKYHTDEKARAESDTDEMMLAEEAENEAEDVRFSRELRTMTSKPLQHSLYPHHLPARQVWIRYPIADGAALHVRRDIDISQRKKIDQLIRLADAILNTSAKGEGSDE